MRLHLLSIVVGLSIVAGCSRKPPVDEPLAPVPAQGFVTAWKADIKFSDEVERLFAIDDYVFAYTPSREVGVLSRSQGLPVFKGEVGTTDRVIYPPVVLKDWVVYPTLDKLHVYDRKGNFQWTLGLREPMRSAAVGDEKSTMYFALANGRIAAIKPQKQPTKAFPSWERIDLEEKGFSAAPFYNQNQVFAGSRTGTVYALRADNGAPSWPNRWQTDYGFQTHGSILADVSSDNTGVYAASTDGQLYCLNVNDGQIRWTYYAQTALGSECTPIPLGDTLYMFIPGKGFVAIDKGAGEGPVRSPKWTLASARQLLSADDRATYFLTTDNRITAVDKATGKTLYRSKRTDFVAFATNLRDNTIFAVTEFGRVYAIKPAHSVPKNTMVEVVELDTAELDAVAAAK